MRDTLTEAYLRHSPRRNRGGRFHDHAGYGAQYRDGQPEIRHPTPEAMERAFERLEALNQKAAASLPKAQNRQLPTTISATLKEVDAAAVA